MFNILLWCIELECAFAKYGWNYGNPGTEKARKTFALEYMAAKNRRR
jgi:hypothetical protein